jgi:hypothetical protein
VALHGEPPAGAAAGFDAANADLPYFSAQVADDGRSSRMMKEAAEMMLEPAETKLILSVPPRPLETPELCAGCSKTVRARPGRLSALSVP